MRIALAAVLAAAVAIATPLARRASEQVAYAEAIAPGAVLDATERIGPGRLFANTAVLILRHGADGTTGVVLSTRLETGREREGRSGAPPAGVAGLDSDKLYWGGPVASDEGVVLAPPGPGLEELPRVALGFAIGLAPSRLAQVGASRPGARMFLGHSGWSPGQLAGEVARGHWRVFEPAAAADHPALTALRR